MKYKLLLISFFALPAFGQLSELQSRAIKFTHYLVAPGSGRLNTERFSDSFDIISKDTISFTTYRICEDRTDSFKILQVPVQIARTIIKRDSVYVYVNYLRPIVLAIGWIKGRWLPNGAVYSYAYEDQYASLSFEANKKNIDPGVPIFNIWRASGSFSFATIIIYSNGCKACGYPRCPNKKYWDAVYKKGGQRLVEKYMLSGETPIINGIKPIQQ